MCLTTIEASVITLLTGMDVARKVVILARECGLEIELSDVKIESLVPGPLQQSPSPEAFLEGLPEVQKFPI